MEFHKILINLELKLRTLWSEVFVKLSLVLKAIFVMLCVGNLFSCRGGASSSSITDDATTTPTTTEPITEDSGVVDNAAGFKITIVPKTTGAYDYVIHEGDGSVTDDYDKECVVDETSLITDITCTVEAKELDLFYHGVRFNVNVPQDMCEYVAITRPYYYNFIPGTGPAIVIDNRLGSSDVTVASITAAAGTLKVGNDVKTTSYCDYDYSTTSNPGYIENGPNCCSGDYDSYVTDSEGVVTSTESNWGGKYSNCLQGAAMQSDGFNGFSSNGFPKSTIFNVMSTGLNRYYSVVSPLSVGFGTNVFVANYFNPADHGNTAGIPACMVAMNGAPATNPYHLFECFDRAGETLASIKVMVREWNLDSEYLMGASGDPDAGLNSFADLFDLGNVTPVSGDSTSIPKEIAD